MINKFIFGLIVFSATFGGHLLSSVSASDIFAAKVDTMPVILTHLSYISFDQGDNFMAYNLAYGRDDNKNNALRTYFTNTVADYQRQGWMINFNEVGKGVFGKSSSGMVIATKCSINICDIRIAFRGTRTLDDWGSNLGITQVPLRFNDNQLTDYRRVDGAKVHSGFLNSYNTVSQSIADQIRNIRKDHKGIKLVIRIAGHSLGGALATLCAAHLALSKEQNDVIQLETYGSPRVLSDNGASLVISLIKVDNILRVVNYDDYREKDIVPETVASDVFGMKFAHVGNECSIYAKGPDIYEGVKDVLFLRTPHRVEGYKEGYLNKNAKCERIIKGEVGSKCHTHFDCQNSGNVGGPGLACCNEYCTDKKRDWAGVYYCPHECRGGAFLGAGTCN